MAMSRADVKHIMIEALREYFLNDGKYVIDGIIREVVSNTNQQSNNQYVRDAYNNTANAQHQSNNTQQIVSSPTSRINSSNPYNDILRETARTATDLHHIGNDNI